MGRKQNTKERRAQIAQGLIRVMSKRGYDGASIAQIADTAGLASGLVHYHYRNKQAILLEALAMLSTSHNSRVDEELGSGSAPLRLVKFIDLHLGLGAAQDPNALASWIVITAEALRQPEVKAEFTKATHELLRRLEQILNDGVREGDFEVTDVTEASAAIVAAIQGYYMLASAAPDVIPHGSAARSVRSMAVGLVGRLPELPT